MSCAEIAREAGVNHARVYYYFRTKEKLFDQLFEQKAVQLLDFFAEAFDRELPFEASDLLLNIASLNVATFVIYQVFSGLDKGQTNGVLKQFMEERKQNNVNTIINSLKL